MTRHKCVFVLVSLTPPSSSDHVQPGPSPHHPGRDDPERTRRGDEQEPHPRAAHRPRQDGRRLRLQTDWK